MNWFRAKSRRGVTSVSYKEASDEKTDSDELLDVEPPVEIETQDTSETIEKVLAQRIGKKGGCLKYIVVINIVVIFVLACI